MRNRAFTTKLSSLRAIMVVVLVAVCVSDCSAAGPASPATGQPAERIIGLGFENVVDQADGLPQVARRLDEVHANEVSISVGRTDWTAFPWAAHPDAWSAGVRSTRRDYVADAINAVGHDATGRPRNIIAVVDVLAEAWIAADPRLAGVSADGRRSTSTPSLTALTAGPIGERLIEFVSAVSSRYRLRAVSLTELFFDTDTFGADDLASYRKATGAADWPRTASGSINQSDPSLETWRSKALTGLVARAAAAAHAHGVSLEMEIRAPWQDPHGDPLHSGQDINALLGVADRLIVWDYFALNGYPAAYSGDIARALSARGAGRCVMSIGLWANNDGTISAQDLRTANDASVRGGANAIWVTPVSLMNTQLWETLREAWAG